MRHLIANGKKGLFFNKKYRLGIEFQFCVEEAIVINDIKKLGRRWFNE